MANLNISSGSVADLINDDKLRCQEKNMEKITIKVDAEVAKAYQKITPIKRQQIENLFNDWLKQIIQDRSLDDLITDMQQQASANGLTQEILDNIIKNG